LHARRGERIRLHRQRRSSTPAQFYWASRWAFSAACRSTSTASFLQLTSERVCDINTEEDWQRAERMYAASTKGCMRPTEAFWGGEFGDAYNERSPGDVVANHRFFEDGAGPHLR
jgi:hypothetical protein